MGPTVEIVASSERFPRRSEVIVIGGGIVGVSTALALAEKGIETTLVEKGMVAAEQSSRNWGWCRKTGRDLREIPLINVAMTMWEGMNAKLGRETGFRQQGIVYAAHTEAQRERHERWQRAAAEQGIDSRVLSGRELTDWLPGIELPLAGALYTRSDGRAEPQLATPAMAQYARERGVNLQQHCAVRTLETAGGRISAVVTEHGRIECQSVVIAGGAWSRLLLQGLGVTLPQLRVLSSVLRTRPLAVDLGPCVSLGSVAVRRRLDGGWTVASSAVNQAAITLDAIRFARLFWPAYRVERQSLKVGLSKRSWAESVYWRPAQADRVSIFEKVRVLDPQPHRPTLERMVADLRRAMPAFKDLEIAQSWGGLIDTMPDAIPVISPVEKIPGCVVATGFSGHGFGISPAAGQLAADLVSYDDPVVDPTAFALSRFDDPSNVRAQHWL